MNTELKKHILSFISDVHSNKFWFIIGLKLFREIIDPGHEIYKQFGKLWITLNNWNTSFSTVNHFLTLKLSNYWDQILFLLYFIKIFHSTHRFHVSLADLRIFWSSINWVKELLMKDNIYFAESWVIRNTSTPMNVWDKKDTIKPTCNKIINVYIGRCQ
jgi:hypothetical protein